MVQFYLPTFSHFPFLSATEARIKIMILSRIELTTSTLLNNDLRGYHCTTPATSDTINTNVSEIKEITHLSTALFFTFLRMADPDKR